MRGDPTLALDLIAGIGHGYEGEARTPAGARKILPDPGKGKDGRGRSLPSPGSRRTCEPPIYTGASPLGFCDL